MWKALQPFLDARAKEVSDVFFGINAPSFRPAPMSIFADPPFFEINDEKLSAREFSDATQDRSRGGDGPVHQILRRAGGIPRQFVPGLLQSAHGRGESKEARPYG
jgi:hypothetical protein